MNIGQDVHSTPPGIPPAAPPHPTPRRKPSLILLSAVAAAALAIGGGIGFAAGHRPTPTTSGSAIPTTTNSPVPPPALSPQAAQAQTCEVLKTAYAPVERAIAERDKFNTRGWSDPDLLASVNALVDSMNNLIIKLEGSLSPATPSNLRTAVVEYVAGLRAVSISERNHASNEQLNGTSFFYNQVVDAPFTICGIPG